MIARGNQPHHGSLQVAATHKVIAIRMAIATVVRTRIRKAERKTTVITSKSVTGEVTTETSTTGPRGTLTVLQTKLPKCRRGGNILGRLLGLDHVPQLNPITHAALPEAAPGQDL